LINRQWCIENPKHYKGYGENCWGSQQVIAIKATWRTAGRRFGSDTTYRSFIAFPYTPEYSMQVLKHFYYDLGDKIWGEYGFADGFSIDRNWYAKTHLAIDEGPIVVMIENYRSGLLWKLFMNIPDIQNGLKKTWFHFTIYKK
jgi:hypothetical protein